MEDAENINNSENEKVIVIYDGSCGFCNNSVRFILDLKPSDDLRFVSAQSDLGLSLRQDMNIKEEVDSIITLSKGRYFIKSEAIFELLTKVQSPWKHLRVLKFIPARIRDLVYDFISKNRDRIQESTCAPLRPEDQKYFL